RTHERIGGLLHGLRREHLFVHGQDLALDLDLDRGIGGEEQVGGLLLHHELEERLGVECQVRPGAQGFRRGQGGLRTRGGQALIRGFFQRAHRLRPLSSSSTMCKAPPSSMFLASRLLSSLIRRRSSFFESALRNASSYEMKPVSYSSYSDWSKVFMPNRVERDMTSLILATSPLKMRSCTRCELSMISIEAMRPE